MALTDDSMVMPVSPIYGGGGGFGGFGGGDWGSLIVLFLIAAMFGGFGGGFGGFGGGADNMYPWIVNGQNSISAGVNAGFSNAALASQISGIQNAITSGFGSAEVANCNRAMDAMQTAYGNQIADMNRSFEAQTAVTSGITGLSSQLASCCCENRLATQGLQNVIQSENCADRQALSDGVRDIIASQTAGTQRILDMLCQDKIDAKNEKILELQNQLNMATFKASQVAQDNYLQNALTAQTQYFLALYPPTAATTPVTPTT